MGYVDFLPEANQGCRNGGRFAPPAEAGRFSPIELRVIELATQEDVARQLSPLSRLGRIVETLFGLELKRPLADPRLESLRRFASLACHHPDRLEEADFQDLLEAGFSPGQLHGLVSHLSARRESARGLALA